MQLKSLAACALALASFSVPAAAQVTGILTDSDVELLFKTGAGSPGGGKVTDSGPIISGNYGSQIFGSGSSYASTSDIGPGVIYFKNGNAASGGFTHATSVTRVDIAFTNDGNQTVTPMLRSQIVPAGFGMFIGPAACPDDPSSCNPADPLIGTRPATFDSFSPSGLGPTPTTLLGGASFTFRIYANEYLAYELTGDLSLVYGGGGGNPNILLTNIGQAQADLTGFAQESPVGSRDFLGFTWDATNIDVAFAPGLTLAPGEGATLTYETIVESYTATSCIGGTRPGCLITYSSFGDPVSRGGGGGPAGLIGGGDAMLAFGAFGPLAAPGEDPTGILFDEFTFKTPVFRNGLLTYILDSGAVPEPSSWAMLIAGFGLVGATMRRRRQAAA